MAALVPSNWIAPKFLDQSHVTFYATPSSRRITQVCVSRRKLAAMAVSATDTEKKQAKLMKKKMKKMKKMKNKMMSSSSSSSESSCSDDSSGDECFSSMKKSVLCMKRPASVRFSPTALLVPAGETTLDVIDTTLVEAEGGGEKGLKQLVAPPQTCGRVEVCTGGKCKKNGSLEILEAFRDRIGSRCSATSVVAASSCKCMGMCKQGPNVRLQRTEESNVVVHNGVGVGDVDSLLLQVGFSA